MDKNCISTITGRRFNPTAPEIRDITIEDIAHALSMICRANGHFKMFYSVAQHSINCAMEAKARGLSREIQLACLLHDASEAYIGDMTRPLKRQLTAYSEYENLMQTIILRALEIPDIDKEEQKAVKEIDDSLLYHEFKLYNGEKLFEKEPELRITLPVEEIAHTKIKKQFLRQYTVLKNGENTLLSIGIDGCKGQWIVAVLTDEEVNIHKYKCIDDICRTYTDAGSMIIDIPIGLPDSKEMAERRPDNALRKILKGKASSVFNVPYRNAVYAENKQLAKEENMKLVGKSLSEQSLAIIPAIRQVDKFLNGNSEWKNRLKEGHPEYGFSILNGGVPVMSKKRTDEGALERMQLLEKYCPCISKTIESQRNRDDVLDALCLAIIGKLGLENGFTTVPQEVKNDAEGLNMAIIGVELNIV
ncbi:DUF429 domain-containing protein [Aminipila butyrica]|uniref:DUF429 domain-containing protein n=1 Tax=Aminipila butyrica TaxID=433296 RepID=A0A858BXZ2_9FIRM|nr:DUF429 domain-containing protein [Aminipila butyrica]QIB70069.1 DUF429 domain-containing protein [Aminipila butyrica]